MVRGSGNFSASASASTWKGQLPVLPDLLPLPHLWIIQWKYIIYNWPPGLQSPPSSLWGLNARKHLAYVLFLWFGASWSEVEKVLEPGNWVLRFFLASRKFLWQSSKFKNTFLTNNFFFSPTDFCRKEFNFTEYSLNWK